MYYLAKEQDTTPFVTFEHVANTLEQLEYMGLDGNPLVVEEDRLLNPANPDYISYEFGICHKRVSNGLLVDALTPDVNKAQADLTKSLNVVKTKKTGLKLDVRTFRFNLKDFPLNPAAITVYQAVIKRGNQNTVMSQQGPVVLEVVDLPGFESAMLDAIISVNAETLAP